MCRTVPDQISLSPLFNSNQGAEVQLPHQQDVQPAIISMFAVFPSDFPAMPDDADNIEQVLQTWNVTIHRHRSKVFVDGQPIELTVTEFRLLLFLVDQSGIIFNRSQILEGLNDGLFAVSDRAVDAQICGLRKKLGIAAAYLETVRGQGYRWRIPVV